MLGAASCLFLIYYLPPSSWWRFVAWLMIGLSVYLSYGYARSAIGRLENRPTTTPSWLSMIGLGSFLIAVGLLVVPHAEGLWNGLVRFVTRTGTGIRIDVAFAAIGLGLLLAIAGCIRGVIKGR
jgi:hypothetical protein